MVVLIICLNLISSKLDIQWSAFDKLGKIKVVYNKVKNPVLPPLYLGPEGGIIFDVISSPFNDKKLVAASPFEYHKCENVFIGDTFEIAIPYGLNSFSFNQTGVMTGNNTFILIRDSISYYYTSDNFLTVDTVFLSAKLGAMDANWDTVYMIVGDSLIKSVDGGQSFTFVFDIEDSIGTGNYEYAMDLYPFNSNFISLYVSTGTAGYFLYSSDGGFSFKKYSLPFSSVNTLRFLHLDPNYIFMITNIGIVLTPDAGASWDTVQINYTPPEPMYPLFGFDILPLAPDTFLFSSLVDKGIYKVYKGFGGWYYETMDTSLIPFSFEPVYKNGVLWDTFFVGSNDGICYTIDRGNTWTRYKNRLKAILLMGPSQFCSKKDTSFLITGGGVVYRSFDLVSTGFEELSFKGNVLFFGNNMVNNYLSSSRTLYLITPNFRVLDPSLYRILFYSSNSGNNFSLISPDYTLLYFRELLVGRDINTFYLWNEDSIVKTTDGGNSFTNIYKDPGRINYVSGEGDTIFILNVNDSLLSSFDGGTTFSYLSQLANTSEIYYRRGLKYVFYYDTLTNNVMYYDIQNSLQDTAIAAPSPYHVILHISPSYDNYIYALYFDTLNLQYEIYYKSMPNGDVLSAPIDGFERIVGIFALNNGYIIFYEMGRGLYIMQVTGIREEFSKENGSKIFFPSLVYKDFLTVLNVDQKLFYRVFDVSGRKIIKGFISPKKNIINLKFLKKGVYYIETEKRIYKFIKF